MLRKGLNKTALNKLALRELALKLEEELRSLQESRTAVNAPMQSFLDGGDKSEKLLDDHLTELQLAMESVSHWITCWRNFREKGKT